MKISLRRRCLSSVALLAATATCLNIHGSQVLAFNSPGLPMIAVPTEPSLLSQSVDWNSVLRVARLTDANQQVTDLVLQLDVLNKPRTTYANAVYQVFAKTENSDWQLLYTTRGARLLPPEGGNITLAPEVIPIESLLAAVQEELGQNVELKDVELNCVVQIRYDLPGRGRDLRETIELAQPYSSILLATTVEITDLFTTSTTTPTTTIPDTSSSQPVTIGDRITLSNGYRITLIDVVFSGNSSTWRYYIEELPGAQDLSNWVLELPSCATVVGATPRGELVNPDPNARISGIKWQPGGGFVEGEFSVTLEGSLKVGTVQVAAKGPDVVVGTIQGPACQ